MKCVVIIIALVAAVGPACRDIGAHQERRSTARQPAGQVGRPTHSPLLRRAAPREKPPLTNVVRLVPDLELLPLPPWHRRVEWLTDRTTLRAAFARARYSPPKDALVMAARIRPGVEQPAFEYFSLGGTGFRYSYPERFFVASAIKLLATVGTLWSLNRRGLTSEVWVDLRDIDGHFRGSVRELIWDTLLLSANLGYDRLIEIAGFDAINDGFLVAAHGLPRAVIQVRFGGRRPGISLRSSPPYSWRQGRLRGRVGERDGTGRHPQCPQLETCVSLYEMQEVMRRLMLHRELPAHARYALAPADVTFVQPLLRAAQNRLQPGISQALRGASAAIFNNVGRVPGRDLVENAYIIDQRRGDRYLLAVLVPFPSSFGLDPKGLVRKRLMELAKRALTVLARRRRAGLTLQHGASRRTDGRYGSWAGLPLTIALSLDELRRLVIQVHVQGAVDRLAVWLGRRRLMCRPTRLEGPAGPAMSPGSRALRGRFVCRAAIKKAEVLLTVQARHQGLPVAYHLLNIRERPR